MAFEVDTGTQGGGSEGPWIQWYSAGSAGKRIEPQSWAIRDKDANDEIYYRQTDQWERGVIWDLDTLKLGWTADDGGPGRAPTRRYAPTPNLTAFPNPEPDRKKANGKSSYWAATVCIRIALSNTDAVTWEQHGFGAFEAFHRIAPTIQQQYASNGGDRGMCPVIRQTSVEKIAMKQGQPSYVPLLEIVKWVPKPECLKGTAPAIDTGQVAATPAPAAAPQPAAQAAPAAQQEDDAFTF